MRSLAFLLVASLIFLFVGLLANGGQKTGLVSAIPPLPPLVDKKHAQGSANLKKINSSAPLPVPAKKMELVEALLTQDYCRAYTRIRKLNDMPIDLSQEISALLNALDAPPDLQELYSAEGALTAATNSSPKLVSPLARFLFALRVGGLYSNNFSAKLPDRARARELLLDLEKEDPTNGAYPYMRLSLEHELKYSHDSLRETAAKVARANRFDTLLTGEMRKMENTRWQSLTNYTLLTWLAPHLGRPQFGGSLDALNAITGPDAPNGDDLKNQVGELMKLEAKLATSRAETFGFDPIVYTYGTLASDEEDQPPSYQISERLGGDEWIYISPSSSKNCDLQANQSQYEKLRGIR